MQEEEKIGFWEQYFYACCLPAQYRKLLLAGKNKLVAYLLVLVTFLVLLENVIPFAAWDVSVGGLRNLFLNGLPAFSVEDGHFTAEEALSFTLGGALQVKADPAVTEYTQADCDDEYLEEILVARDSIFVKAPGGVQRISFADFASLRIDNQTLVHALPALYAFFAFYIVLSFLIKAVQYLFIAFMFALICRGSAHTPEGEVVSMRDSFVIAIYARTLFAFLNSANVALGYLVDSTMLFILSAIVTMVFIVRAEVSVLNLRITD